MLPFSPAVLAQVERLGGTWRHVPADADALTEKVMQLKTATEVKAMLQAAAR